MATSPSGQRGSAGRIAAVALTAIVVGSAAVAGVAVFSTGGAAASATGTAATSNPIKFVYVDGTTNNVTFVREDGTTVGTNRSADIVGSMGDLDDDGFLEAPFVTSQGEIWAIDANNETQFIADQTYTSNTKLSVADWTGDGTPEVLYANTSANNYLYYANTSGTPTQLSATPASSVLGVEDFTDSGERDLLYVGTTSKNLWYYNSSSGATDTGYGNFANEHSAGAPRDFYRTGEQLVPAIDGSGYVELVDASGDVDQVTTSNVDKTPVAGVNWTGDAKLEVLVIKNGVIEYTHLNGTRNTLYDASGNSISANQGAGIAGVAIRSDTALAVSEFDATASGNQNVTLSLETNEQLTSLNLSVSGVENATLGLGDFSESGTGPYTYTATYDGSTDGDYTVTLERVESDDVITEGRTDSVTVDDVRPSVDSVGLADATDADGTVQPGDDVTVSATVTGDVGTVTADLSAFDAGTVTLAHASGDTYTATVQVGPDPTDGEQAATVQAADGQGNSDTGTSGTLTVNVETGDTTTSTTTVDVEVTVEETTTTTATTTTATTTTATTTTATTTTATTQTTTATTESDETTTATPTTTEDAETVTTASSDETTTTTDDDGGSVIGEAPGFGLGLALLAMVGAALLALRE
jgi:hypothetical protein